MQRLRQQISNSWYQFLEEDQKTLVKTSISLYEMAIAVEPQFEDYSFVIFPMSKAYEGFLKKYLFEMGLISEKVYFGKKFRIGRSLNPDLSARHRDEYWHYDNIEKMCGKEVGRDMWNTWLECRNGLFHYFPGKSKTLNIYQAHDYLMMLTTTMQQLIECKE